MPLKHARKAIERPRTLLMLLAALLLAGLAQPAMAADASWGGFFGRTHVLMLHLPIGLLIGAFAIEVLGFLRRSRGYDVAAMWMFILGAASTVPAVLTGLLLGTEWASDNAGGEPMAIYQLIFADSIEQGVTETLGWHMWLGITLLIVSIIAAVLKVVAVRKQWKHDSDEKVSGGLPLMGARLALVGTMAALPFAGHLGGNMTHGNEFLVERLPLRESIPDSVVYWPEKVEATVAVSGADGADVKLVNGSVAFWNAKIQPALNKHCIACHSASKQNGKLRLDSLKWAVKGGSSGGTIEPGDVEFSEVYRRVTLPPSHEDFMPTNVEKYGMMSLEDIHTLGEWLLKYDGRLKDPEPKKPEVKDDATEAKEAAAEKAALRDIAAAGGNANSLSQSQPELSVKFAYLKTLSPDALAKLDAIADQIAWLTFEGSALDDDGVGEMPDLPILTELNLKDTKITDKGVTLLPEMQKLEWLNLFGTAVTDQSIDKLKDFTGLKKVYLTGTKVTAEGVAKLREALPETQVFSDHDSAFTFPKNVGQPPKPESEKTPDEKVGAGKPINTKCPVSGAAIKPGFVSTYKGKTIGFCCNNCKGKFDANPEKFASKLPK